MGGDTQQNHAIAVQRGVYKASVVTSEIVARAKAIATENFGEQPDPVIMAAIIQALAATHASMVANPTNF